MADLPLIPHGVRVRPCEGRTNEASQVYEEQIIGVLREHEAGVKTAGLARKHSVSEATLYNLEG